MLKYFCTIAFEFDTDIFVKVFISFTNTVLTMQTFYIVTDNVI